MRRHPLTEPSARNKLRANRIESGKIRTGYYSTIPGNRVPDVVDDAAVGREVARVEDFTYRVPRSIFFFSRAEGRMRPASGGSIIAGKIVTMSTVIMRTVRLETRHYETPTVTTERGKAPYAPVGSGFQQHLIRFDSATSGRIDSQSV